MSDLAIYHSWLFITNGRRKRADRSAALSESINPAGSYSFLNPFEYPLTNDSRNCCLN